MGRLIPIRSAAGGSSLFGKLPLALDFVRINHDSAESNVLDRWLQTSLQRLAARGQSWPSGPLRFFASSHASTRTLLGVVTASSDRAGRRFPVAVYTRVANTWLGDGVAALVLAGESFLCAAEALLARVAQLPLDRLSRVLEQLPVPEQLALREADRQLDQQLSQRSLASFAHSAFEDVPLVMALEAFRRLLNGPRRAGNTYDAYDCPAQTPIDAAIWCSLLAFSQPMAASCLWQASARGAAPRVLLAHSGLPERAALYWATPDHKHPRLCRLGGGAVNVTGELPNIDDAGHKSLADIFARLAHSV